MFAVDFALDGVDFDTKGLTKKTTMATKKREKIRLDEDISRM